MTQPQRLKELLARIFDGSEETEDVEYIGRFIVNGKRVLRVPDDELEQQWAASIISTNYLPLYGFKIGEPAMAGGMFEAAPFYQLDRSSLHNRWLNLPPRT